MPAGTETRTQKRRTYRTEREMKTLRYTYLVGLALTMLATLATGCQDDPLFSAPGYNGNGTATRAEMTQPGPLQQEGEYWVASKRVPLVGVGRIVDNISQGLVSISENADFNNVVDTNLNNYTEISGVDVNALGNQILSVKDLYHTYQGNQAVGFVIGNEDSGSLLDVSVLEFLVISTYRDGQLVGTYNVSSNSNLLSLGVLSSSSQALQTISVTAEEPFDEIMLATTGVSANVNWSGMKIYYAFVGETPINYVYKQEGSFPDAYFLDTQLMGDELFTDDDKEAAEILNPNHEDGILFSSIILELGFAHRTTLHYGQTVEAGTEVGFTYNTATIANLSLGTTVKLTPYDTNGNAIEQDIYEKKGLIGLSVTGGGNGTYSLIPSKDIESLQISFSAVGLDLGGTRLMRAFTREATTVDPTAYFVAPYKVKTNASSYYFMAPQEGASMVDYQLASNPGGRAELAKTDNGGYVLKGMLQGRTYEVVFHCKGADGQEFISTTYVTRVAGSTKDCQTSYMVGQGFSIAEANDMSGIIIISGIKDDNYIIDPDYTDNCASFVSVTDILQHGVYAAVKSDNDLQPAPGETWRVGFTIKTGPGLLGLQALKFFSIALYKDGQEVQNGVAASNNTASVNLINLGGDKVRISIETTQSFDCIALRTAGLLGLNLESLEIYNAFYESASCEEYEVMDYCSQLMTPAQNNLRVDYANTGFTGIDVGAGLYNIGNMMDENTDNYTTVTTVANIGQFSLAFRFEKQTQANKWIGLMLSTPSGLATVDLLSSTTLKTTLNGVVQETITQKEGGLLGLELIGYENRRYIEATPTLEFDGIIVEFNGINVAGDWLFYGLYGIKDLNHNGTEDCTEGEEDVENPGSITLTPVSEHICNEEGLEKVAFDIQATLNNGISSEDTYYLKWLSADSRSGVIPVKVRTNITPNRLVAADPALPLALPVGVYSLTLYWQDITDDEIMQGGATEEDFEVSTGSALLIIHPRQTTWTGGNSTDWNDWSNWTDGSPWGCTDVIIPGGLQSYPILTQADYEAGMNNCARIHIEDGGQIVNTRHLNTYDGAWVDIQLEGGRYYMLASPLKDMASGDWFISPDVTLATSTSMEGLPLFTTFNEITYPEQRTNPTVYQRLWSTLAPVKNPDGYEAKDEVAPDETQWTPPYNAVNQAYSLGMGFSLMANKVEGNKYLFRFPKQHVTYHYYNLAGQPTGMTESISRPSRTGRFIDEAQWNNDKLTVKQTNTEASTAFLVGNPFVSYLNLSAFMSANGISEVKLFDGTTNTNNSLILIDGELVSNAGGYVRRNVMPMEAFFVMTPDGQAKSEMTVTFNANMQTTDAGTTSAVTRSLPSDSFLRLSATLDGKTTHALLRVSPTASAGVIPGEDTKLLVESEARPAVAIYTVADGQALDIQQVPDDVRRIPLGFYLPDGGSADIRLKADFTDPQWHDWFLLDLRTGQRRRLNTATLTLEDVRNGSGQYALTRED